MALLGNCCSVSVQSSEAQQIPRVISAITVYEKKTVRQTQIEREREREREINFLVANLGALDVVEFSTEPSDNSSNLEISMEDYIKH